MTSAPLRSVGHLLGAGEGLVWSGRPGTGFYASQRQIAALAFTTVWWLVLLVIGWEAWGLRDSPLVLVVGGILLIGALQDSWRTGRWLLRRWGEQYVITDRRVLIVGRDDRIRADVSLLTAHTFHWVAAPGWRGTIVLGPDQPIFSLASGRRLDLNPQADAPRLSGLDKAEQVFTLLMKTAAEREAQWAASTDA